MLGLNNPAEFNHSRHQRRVRLSLSLSHTSELPSATTLCFCCCVRSPDHPLSPLTMTCLVSFLVHSSLMPGSLSHRRHAACLIAMDDDSQQQRHQGHVEMVEKHSWSQEQQQQQQPPDNSHTGDLDRAGDGNQGEDEQRLLIASRGHAAGDRDSQATHRNKQPPKLFSRALFLYVSPSV